MRNARYEQTLVTIYDRMVTLAEAHDQHPIPSGTCPDDDRCEALANLMFDALEHPFGGDGVAESWLADGPADLLDWYSELGGSTPREVIEGALRSDAAGRLFPNYATVPVHPSTTIPEENA